MKKTVYNSIVNDLKEEGYEFDKLLPYGKPFSPLDFVTFHSRKIYRGPYYIVYVKRGGINNSLRVINAYGKYYYLHNDYENIYIDNTTIIEVSSKWP